MKKIFLFVLIPSLFIECYSQRYDRKGVFVELGLGPGYSQLLAQEEIEGRTSFAINFKLGYGLSNRVQVYAGFLNLAYLPESWDRTKEWIGGDDFKTVLGTALIYPVTSLFYERQSQIVGLGLRYFLRQRHPSLFFDIGFGKHLIYDLIYSKYTFGQGIYSGLGYEFDRHINVALQLLWTSAATTESTTNVYSVFLTINFLKMF